jgi:hypothetical protein
MLLDAGIPLRRIVEKIAVKIRLASPVIGVKKAYQWPGWVSGAEVANAAPRRVGQRRPAPLWQAQRKSRAA